MLNEMSLKMNWFAHLKTHGNCANYKDQAKKKRRKNLCHNHKARMQRDVRETNCMYQLNARLRTDCATFMMRKEKPKLLDYHYWTETDGNFKSN